MSSPALQALRNADLARALAELQNEVRRDPAQSKHRVFLFQLLSVLGQWERALNQLNVARDLDPSTLEMAQTYQEALLCEALRARVFAGERSPLFFGEPEPWMALFWQAHTLTVQGRVDEAAELRDRALADVPTPSGRLWLHADAGSASSVDEAPPGTPPCDVPYGAGHAFEWIGDADPRLAPVLEAIINGRYYWVPWNRIHRIDLEKPSDLRDCVWLPAHFEWVNGGEVVGLIPARYPGSETSTDDLVRLARKTDWLSTDTGTTRGLGQRLLATQDTDYALFEIRRIVWDATPDAPS